jgi:chemotaxis response regulator CheB
MPASAAGVTCRIADPSADDGSGRSLDVYWRQERPMALLEFFRRKRASRPDYPVVEIADLSPEGQAFIADLQRRGALAGWTREELEEHERRTLAGHEEELREAIREADEHRRQRRSQQK